MDIKRSIQQAKKMSKKTALLSAQTKNEILQRLAEKLEEQKDSILKENAKDVAEAEKNGMGSMKDRLLLTDERITAIANDVRAVAKLPDYIGKTLPTPQTPSGIQTKKITVPLGVIAMIYESRPNVTIDAAVLAFKSGNAIILKGGKEAKYSNAVLADIFRLVLQEHNITDAVQLLYSATREDTQTLLQAKGDIDLLIPRGGKGLINFVTENARVPVIETGASVVHTFVDASANFEMAKNIILNEKTRRVSVCNALDTVLVHKDIAPTFIPFITKELEEKMVTVHNTQNEEVNFSMEWLGYDITLHQVESIDAALSHIEEYSLGHSECIITEDEKNAQQFLQEVDAACVYHNASTCFSDGAEFGLGAEIGISTQKLHARGPFAYESLMTYKWIICGTGEVR